MIFLNPAIWLGYPFSEHADSAQPRIPTLYTRPTFAQSKGGVWERDYLSICGENIELCTGIAYNVLAKCKCLWKYPTHNHKLPQVHMPFHH